MIKECSSKTFFTIFNELCRELFGDVVEPDSLVDFAKLMGYPNITKSWVSCIGLQHTWGSNLGFLSWLSEIYVSSLTNDFEEAPDLRLSAQNFASEKDFGEHLAELEKSLLVSAQLLEDKYEGERRVLERVRCDIIQLEEDQPSVELLLRQKQALRKAEEENAQKLRDCERQIKKEEAICAKKQKSNEQLSERIREMSRKKQIFQDKLGCQELNIAETQRIRSQIESLNSKLDRLNQVSEANERSRYSHKMHLQKVYKSILELQAKMQALDVSRSLAKPHLPQSPALGKSLLSLEQFYQHVFGTSSLKQVAEEVGRSTQESDHELRELQSKLAEIKRQHQIQQYERAVILTEQKDLQQLRQQLQDSAQREREALQSMVHSATHSKTVALSQNRRLSQMVNQLSNRLYQNNSTVSSTANCIKELKAMNKRYEEEQREVSARIEGRMRQLAEASREVLSSVLEEQCEAEAEMRLALAQSLE